MAKPIHQEFEEHSEKGIRFIELWNKQDRDGAHKVIAETFQISIPTVYRIRKKLELKHIHSKEHPGRKKLYKRIKRLYYQFESTAKVGKAEHRNARFDVKTAGLVGRHDGDVSQLFRIGGDVDRGISKEIDLVADDHDVHASHSAHAWGSTNDLKGRSDGLWVIVDQA